MLKAINGFSKAKWIYGLMTLCFLASLSIANSVFLNKTESVKNDAIVDSVLNSVANQNHGYETYGADSLLVSNSVTSENIASPLDKNTLKSVIKKGATPNDLVISEDGIQLLNTFNSDVLSVIESNDWDGLINNLSSLSKDDSILISYALVECAKKNAPSYVYSALANIGAELPKNAIRSLIGVSSAETINELSAFGLDLHYVDPVVGDAYAMATITDAGTDTFELLFQSDVKFSGEGVIDTVGEIISKSLTSKTGGDIQLLANLIDHGALITKSHYDKVARYRNYKPEIYEIVSNHYSSSGIN